MRMRSTSASGVSAVLLIGLACATTAGCSAKQVGGTLGAVAGAAVLDDNRSAGAEIGSAVGKAAAKKEDEPVVNSASDRQQPDRKGD